MTAELEIETKQTGFVTCVEVLLVDGSRCWYPRAELTSRPAEVSAVIVSMTDVKEELDRMAPRASTKRDRRSDTGYYDATKAACANSCDSPLVILCNGRRSASKGHCICSCHVVTR